MKFPNNLKAWRKKAQKTQDDLAAVLADIGDTNANKQKIYKIETGNQRMRPEEVIAFAKFLGCKIDDLIGAPDYEDTSPAPFGLAERPYPKKSIKIPVWGVVDAQDGERYALNTEDTPIDWIDPLTVQENDKDAFGLLISGESMMPKYEPGYIACVNTRKPAIKGKDCVIELKDGGAFIKRYLSSNGDEYIFEQLNPAKKLTINKKDIKRLLPVVGVIYDK